MKTSSHEKDRSGLELRFPCSLFCLFEEKKVKLYQIYFCLSFFKLYVLSPENIVEISLKMSPLTLFSFLFSRSKTRDTKVLIEDTDDDS